MVSIPHCRQLSGTTCHQPRAPFSPPVNFKTQCRSIAKSTREQAAEAIRKLTPTMTPRLDPWLAKALQIKHRWVSGQMGVATKARSRLEDLSRRLESYPSSPLKQDIDLQLKCVDNNRRYTRGWSRADSLASYFILYIGWYTIWKAQG